MPNEHDCLEHLYFKQADWVETHGLDCGPYENCHEEWWECSVCKDRFTDKELHAIYEKQERGAPF